MAVRASMSYLISFVRELITDPAGADQTFTDIQIQDRLDLNRKDLYQDCLRSADSLQTDGTLFRLDWFSELPFWETDVVIQQVGGLAATPDDANYLVGKFSYDDNQSIPLVATGRVYDVYGVASNLLTIMTSELRDQFNWTADGTTVQRVAQVKDMQALATKYAGMGWGWGRQIKLKRKDLRN
jgi:hypothetical protein